MLLPLSVLEHNLIPGIYITLYELATRAEYVWISVWWFQRASRSESGHDTRARWNLG